MHANLVIYLYINMGVSRYLFSSCILFSPENRKLIAEGCDDIPHGFYNCGIASTLLCLTRLDIRLFKCHRYWGNLENCSVKVDGEMRKQKQIVNLVCPVYVKLQLLLYIYIFQNCVCVYPKRHF